MTLQLHFAMRLLPVPTSHKEPVFYISPGMYIGLCALLVIFPIEWILSWIVAAVVHELSHCIILRLLYVRMYAIQLHLFGAKIITEPIPPRKECIAALAGPLSGILMILIARVFPHLAVCAFIQTTVNLIPVREFDGGRVLHSIVEMLFDAQRADLVSRVVEISVLFFALLAGIYISVVQKTAFLLPVAVTVLILRRFQGKIPCKRRKQIVQYTQSNTRGTIHE